MELAPGMMVTANVRLTEALGEGAMGCVWVAEHLTLKTNVAVKFISEHHAANDLVLQRFGREASTAAQIKSPHVVQTFDQGLMADGTPYIVMELLDGASLQERLDRSGPLSLEEAAEIITHVGRALSKAHKLGIVHRDIKPDNIFLTSTDDGPFAKILDFGIAKQTQLPKMGGLTDVGVMVGTPEFMSPEQVISSKDVNHHADLWGLAVTMYQALTNDLPFTAEALGTLCVKLLDGRFTPATELRGDLPGQLDSWFNRALANEPGDRFPDVRTMTTHFVEIVSPRPTQLTPPQPLAIQPPAPIQPPAQAASIETLAPETYKAKSETLTGSSASRRRVDKRWLGASLAGAAGVVVLLFVVALASNNDSNSDNDNDSAVTPAADIQASDQPSPAVESEPAADDALDREREGDGDEEADEPNPARPAASEPPAPAAAPPSALPSATSVAKPQRPPSPPRRKSPTKQKPGSWGF